MKWLMKGWVNNMKCKKCGSNLEIDSEVCPYCGMVNPIAQKHREDMKKYSADYEETKDQVITKSKKVNNRSIRIAVIAITALLIGTSVILDSFVVSLRFKHQRNLRREDSDKYYAEVEQLISSEDYFKISEIVLAHDLNRHFDDSDSLLMATCEYRSLYDNVMKALEEHSYSSDRYAGYISQNIVNIDNAIYRSEPESAEWKKYSEDLLKDTQLLLKVYLNISEEQYRELIKMDNNKRVAVLTEVLDEVR